ncbi:hypothetical protein [uncultured Muribaculum sp.]|uniref:hypothetical protein n=1 Tax=uncultured Muribaculum sp. TaxID=1918613 RepID=UPI0026704CDC|nr:hypothetical protein [uncultured Muribaculum sp.]
MSRFVTVVIIFQIALSAFAQFEVKGRLINSKGEGVEFATIKVFTENSDFVKGTTTDSLGFYLLEFKHKGIFKVQLSSLSYKPFEFTLVVSKPLLEAPDIPLEDKTTELENITIVGGNMVRQDNHLLITPDKMAVKHSFSAYQLLDNLKLPGFDVQPNSGSVTLFDKNVSLYIDGEPADYNLVKNLRSKDIEKIEYHDVPTGRYSNDYAAINFITRKFQFGGYANLMGQQNIGHLNGTYEAYTQLGLNETRLHVMGGYTMWDMARSSTNTSEWFNFPDSPVSREDLNRGGRTSRDLEYGQLRVSSNNQLRQISVSASMVHNYSTKNRNSELKYSEPYNTSELSNSVSKSNMASPSLSIFSYFNLPNNQFFYFNGSGSYTHNHNKNTYSANNKPLIYGATENYYYIFADMTYGKSFKHRNSIEFAIVESYTNSSIDYTGEYSSWQHLWHSETLIFAGYRQKFSKFSIYARPGLSLKYSRVHRQELIAENGPRLYIEGIYRPTAFQQLKASAAFGNSAVSIAKLSDAERPVDFLTTIRGNPGLKPNMLLQTYNLNYSTQFGRCSAAADITYNRTQDAPITDYYFDNGKLIESYISGNDENINSYVSLSWNANKSFRLNVTGNHIHTWTKAANKYELDHFSANINASYYWRDFMVNITASTPKKSPLYWGYTKMPATYGLTLNWNHKNWSASAWITNPFNHIKTSRKFTTPSYNSFVRTIQTRSGFVKITYTFDFGKKIQHTGIDKVNTSTNTLVL